MGGLFSSKQKSTSKSYTEYPEELQSLLDSIVSKTTDLYNQDYTPYTADRVAGLSADEQSAFQLVRDLTSKASGGYSTDTLQGYMNPYQEMVMDTSKQRQLEAFDLQKRALAEQQANIGAFGGSRAGLAESALYKDFAQQLTDNETAQLYQGYNEAYGRAQQGTQQGLQLATALQAAGTSQRTLDQAQMDIDYQDYLTGLQWPYQQIQFAQGIANPSAQILGTNISQQTSKSTPSIASTVMGIASMAMGMPGIGAAIGGGLGSAMAGMGMSGSAISAMNSFMPGNSVYSGAYGAGNIAGAFKEGGKVQPPNLEDFVSDPTFWENNDFISNAVDKKLLRDLAVKEGIAAKRDAELDQETYPGGPTRRELMKVWQAEGLGDYELEPLESGKVEGGLVKKGYACGGKVKHYADGGILGNLFKAWSKSKDYLDNMKLPFDTYRHFEPASEGYEDEDESPLQQAYLRMLQNEVEDGEYTPSSRAGKFIAPAVNALEGLGDKAKAFFKGYNPVEAPYEYLFGEDRGETLSETNKRVALEDAQKLPTRRPETEDKIEALMQALAPKAAKKEVAQTTPTTVAKEKDEDDDGFNAPLFLFGATLLSSGGKNFTEALGDAGKVYAQTKMGLKTAKQEAKKEAKEMELAERKAKAYEMQTQLALSKIPLQQEIQRLKADKLKRELAKDPAMQKLVLEMAKADPTATPEEILEKATTLAGMSQQTDNTAQFLGFE